MNRGALNGNLDLVKRFYSSLCAGDPDNALRSAVEIGHMEMVQWLLERRCTYSGPIVHNVMNWAASYGHMKMVRWLHETQSEAFTADAVDHAASGGHLDIVKFLLANGSMGCAYNAMDNTASNSHKYYLRYLLSDAPAAPQRPWTILLPMVTFTSSSGCINTGPKGAHQKLSTMQLEEVMCAL